TSDHNSLEFSLHMSSSTTDPLPSFDFPKGNYTAMESYLNSIDWLLFFSLFCTINDCFEAFLKMIHFMVEKFVPVKQTRRGKSYPKHIQRVINEKRRLWRKRMQTNGMQIYKDCANKCKSMISNYVRSVEKKIVKKRNPRAFYSFVNSHLTRKTGVAPLRDKQGKVHTAELAKAGLLQEQFKSVFTIDDNSKPAFPRRTSNSLSFIDITLSDVLFVIKKFPKKLSDTPDHVPSFFFKTLSTALSYPLLYLFRMSMMIGNLPDVWKTAIVSPIFKKSPAGSHS
ncbi:MAG: hypothetical protein AAF391_13515, partial [Bacteroidota bacterium]